MPKNGGVGGGGLPETEPLGLLYGQVEPVPELGLRGVGRQQEVVEARVGGGEAVRVAPVLADHQGLSSEQASRVRRQQDNTGEPKPIKCESVYTMRKFRAKCLWGCLSLLFLRFFRLVRGDKRASIWARPARPLKHEGAPRSMDSKNGTEPGDGAPPKNKRGNARQSVVG